MGGMFSSAKKGTMKGRGKRGKREEKSERARGKGKKKGKKGGKNRGKGKKKRKNGRNIAKWWGRFSRGLMRGGECFQKI